jgi:aspartyl/asparaginyl-tRNA synthetase
VAGTVQHLERLAGSATALPRLTFDEASRVVQKRGGRLERNREHGFRTMPRASERLLMSYCGGITWLTNWDQLAVPFYQALAPETGKTLNADLLIGQGEALGAGERHATGDEVRAALQLHGVSADEYEWYIAMKDFFPLKTSGFGLGIERFLLWVLDHDDVRDLQLLPRMYGSGIIP